MSATERDDDLPEDDHAWELAEWAFAEPDGFHVLGWSDSGVIEVARDRPRSLTFTVTSTLGGDSHEGAVLVLALRVPHPDYCSLADVIGRPR